MEEIKPSALVLFRDYLLMLEALPDDRGLTFYPDQYKIWKEHITLIQETAISLIKFLKKIDLGNSDQVWYDIKNQVRDEFLVYKDHMSYFLTGIEAYRGRAEIELMRTGLLEKRIEEMTGFEFRTLLLATLNEHSERQKQ